MKLIPTINRIVIGDVGSGKTIVAFLVALSYLHGLEGGFGDVCLLAPTEVLAYQHYISLRSLIQSISTQTEYTTPITIYLSSKQRYINDEPFTKAQFAKKLIELKENKSQIFWIGTHSLLHLENFAPLLVLIDEQHRFGVEQRKKLTHHNGELETSAHFISFTATPIPRTLALTLFDSLKPHYLSTLSSRKPIKTTQHTLESFNTTILPLIKARIEDNEKVYVIVTKVQDKEEGEDEEVWSIKKTTTLLEGYFPDQVLTVHGKEKEKQAILTEFKESESKHILVATTVVEVGVDVGKATLMVIVNAERYGLSALHQIRGRIGRNDKEDNLCVLVTPEKYQFIKRLNYIKQSNDGFELAQKDLELRGGGDVVGKLQSGFDYEIDEILGLEPEKYEELKVLSQTALADPSLSRLHTYVDNELKRVWDE